MVNGDVLFTTKFRLDLEPNRTVEIYDDIDYTGLGEDINDFVGIVKVSGPSGVIYENTDFNNPDIVPGTSRQMTTLIYLILDALDNYQVMKGQYTIKYSVKDTVSENTYENTNVYGFHFDVPVMAVDVDSGPYSAKLRSDDETDYGSDIFLLTREHRIQYPTDLALPDIVTTLASYEVDPIYTNLWTTIITSTVDYKQAADDLEYKWYGTKTVTHCVTGACISSFYNSIDEMLTLYKGYMGVNPNMAGEFRERLQQINTAWQLLDIAWMYLELEEADKQSEVIRELIQESGINLCPSGSSIQVDPCPPWAGGQGGGFYSAGTGIDITNKVISLTDYGEIKVSIDDTTPGFVENKFAVAHGVNTSDILELTTLSPGGNEILQLQLDESKISHNNIADVGVDDHHNQAHVLATSGDHTGALPLIDLDNYAAGALMYGGAVDWEPLASSTEGYVLKMGATYPEWADVAYSHPNHSGHVTSVGDGATTLTVAAITGQTELASGLVNTDELVLSDAGVIKRMDISVLQTYMQDNLNFTTGGFWTLTGNDIYNNNSGNVGVGAAPGAYKFDVTGTGRFTDVITADKGIRSTTFLSSGFLGSGYSLWEDTSVYSLELDNLTVRNRMNVYELVLNKWRAVNGVLWVTDVNDTYEDIDGVITAGIHTTATPLTGTLQTTQASKNIVGTSTLFTTELQIGDEIKIEGSSTEYHIVETITDNTHLTIYENWVSTGGSGYNAYEMKYDMSVGLEGSSFTADDLLVAQKFHPGGTETFFYRVNSVSNETDYWKVYVGNYDKWAVCPQTTVDVIGQTFIKYGNTTNTGRQGSLVLNANDTNNPYQDIYAGVDTYPVTFSNIKVRSGNLEGLAGQGIVPASPGYGLYSDNVYLTGKIIISNPGDINTGDLTNTAGWTDDTAAIAAQALADANALLIPNDASGLIDFADTPSGAGLYLGATHLGYYSGSAWKTYMANNGDFFLTGTSGYLTWDHSTETLTIKGTVNASDGNIGGWDLTSNSIHHGAEKLTDGYATAGTATLAADGSVHLPNFYVNSGGETGIREVEEIMFKIYSSYGMRIIGAKMWEHLAPGPSDIEINVDGYQGGNTEWRSTVLGDGKGNTILRAGGAATKVAYCDIYAETDIKQNLTFGQGLFTEAITVITGSTTITKEEYIVISNLSSGSLNVTLPASPVAGEHHWIKRANVGGVVVKGNGKNINGFDGDHADVALEGWRGWLFVYSSVLNKWCIMGQS